MPESLLCQMIGIVEKRKLDKELRKGAKPGDKSRPLTKVLWQGNEGELRL